MASDFAARVVSGFEHTYVEEYTPSQVTNETFVPGDVVVWDAGNDWVERGGADPTVIWGLSEVDSEEARVLTENGKVPIRKILPGCRLAMASATTYVEATHRGVEYGIVRNASGHWLVDVSETSAVRVVVRDGDATNNIWIVAPLAEHWDDGIDS